MFLRDLIRLLFDGDPPESAAFRLDAASIAGLSFGHLQRCHRLSRTLRNEFGVKTWMVMRNHPEGVRRARELGEEVVHFPLEGAPLPEVFQAGAVIVDLPYAPEPETVEFLSAFKGPTVLMEDRGNEFFPAVTVVNCSVLAEPGMYPRSKRLLLGPEYLPLPDRYWSSARIPGQSGARPRLLLTYGGSDPSGATAQALEALGAQDRFIPDVTVVMGPGFRDHDRVEKLAGLYAGNAVLLRNPPDMLPLFLDCDVASCAGGITLYELLALGVPTVGVGTIAHEEAAVLAFLHKGLLKHGMGRFDPATFVPSLEAALAQADTPVNKNAPQTMEQPHAT